MEPTRNHCPHRPPAASRRSACLLLVLRSVIPVPAGAQDTALPEPLGPVLAQRFHAAPAVNEMRPATASGEAPGPPTAPLDPSLGFAAPLGPLPATLAGPASSNPSQGEPRSTWAVAGAALAGGALGWAVGGGVGLLATHDRFAQDDLSPLLYAAIGGVAVSVPAAAVSAHWASRGRGSILTSTLLGYAVAGVTILAWPDGGWALGPALAIPIAISVEVL